MMRSHTQEAGAGYLIINGEVCYYCGKPFTLSDYDARHTPDVCGEHAHPECCEACDEES